MKDAPGTTQHQTEISAADIADVINYRVFKGNEQWCVRWVGCDDDDTSWEAWHVLDTAELRRCAEQLKAQNDT